MNTFIALLRGINVSGQKKIKMADLRIQLSATGLQEVQTYIQSGNVVFGHETALPTELEEMIRQNIRDHYRFEVSVLVKTCEELESVIRNNPWSDDPDKDEKKGYFTLLDAVPAPELVENLRQMDHGQEEWVLVGKDIYFFPPPQGYGRAKMSNNYFEQKLKVTATTRNWNTLNKLIEMAR